MLTKKEMEGLLTKCLSTGATYAELYYQEKTLKNYILENKELDTIPSRIDSGIGIRISNDSYQVYASTNSVTKKKVMELIDNLLPSFNEKVKNKEITLIEKKRKKVRTVKKQHNKIETAKKIELLKEIDNIARKTSSLVSQVSSRLIEDSTKVVVANTDGVLTKEKNSWTRLVCNIYVTKDNKKESLVDTKGLGGGYELLDNIDIKEWIKDLTNSAVKKLDSIPAPSGEYPVILASGFGAVIFHESCGHALEATSVAKKDSVFYDQLGKKIASSKVTLIDDGTIPNEWGSMTFDDEGEESRKNILIENGILKGFLIDRFHEKQMNMKKTGSGRRQDYTFIPTSRMTNTYLKEGPDTISDMFKSIDYGIYCKRLSGGTVDPTTGDFNFSASESYLIENGKITKPLKRLSLIGNNKEVLKNVEMVSNDLAFGTGYCGSASGTIYVTCAQPTIKVSKMLIGGEQ